MRPFLAASRMLGCVLVCTLGSRTARADASQSDPAAHSPKVTTARPSANTSSPRAGTLTPAMVIGTRVVSDVALAPDGRLAAYVVSQPRAGNDKPGVPFQEIWVVDTAAGSEPRRFTPAKQRAWGPAFAPDGNRLAFLSTRPTPGIEEDGDETTDLFVLDVRGGEAQLVSDGKLSVAGFRWSPDGHRIAFLAKDAKTDAEKKETKEGRDQVVADTDTKVQRLWIADVATHMLTRVTSDDSNVLGFDWSPDATRFVLRVTSSPRVDDDYMYSSLAFVPVAGGVPALFVPTQGKLGSPLFSPSGKSIAWLGASGLDDPYAGSVFVAPVSGGAVVEATRGHEGVATAVAWKDDETLVVAATHSTETVLELVARRGGAPRVVVQDGPICTDFTVARNGQSVAFAANTPECPNEVYVATLGRGAAKPRRLTTTNPEIESVQLGSQRTIRWKATDGLEIDGVLIEPLGGAAGRRSPLVVVVHGGPESCVRNGWNTSSGNYGQLLARAGYLVLYPNYRGSIGRDDAFERADHGDLMGAEFGDVLAGIDALIAQGQVDPERVGIAGGSYGGYTTAWAATAHSKRFAAAVDFAGITNWISMQGMSDIPEENALVHWDRPFYAHMDLYWQRSPLAHVADCHTPLLLLHGEKDARVPIGQSQEMYTALRLLGRDVEFVHYPREPHGLREAAHQLDMLDRSLAWFDRYLKPSPAGITSRH